MLLLQHQWKKRKTVRWFALLICAAGLSYLVILSGLFICSPLSSCQLTSSKASYLLLPRGPLDIVEEKSSSEYGSNANNDYMIRDETTAFAAESLLQIIENKFARKYWGFYGGSVHHYGSQGKLHNKLLELVTAGRQDPKTFRVGLIGGSSSVPHGVLREQGYFQIFCEWLKYALNPLNIEVICDNSALGATGSNFYAMCLRDIFDLPKYDMLLTEFALNDEHFINTKAPGYENSGGAPFEELVRQAIALNPRLHIVPVIFMPLRHLLLLEYPPKCPVVAIEDIYLELAKRYQLTSLQFRHAFCGYDKWNITKLSRKEQLKYASVFLSRIDGMHASYRIHEMMSEFLVNYFKQSVRRLVRRLHDIDSLGSEMPSINSIIAAETLAISDQVSEVLKKTFYQSTRTDYESECLLSYERGDKQNTRLRASLTDWSTDLNGELDMKLDWASIMFLPRNTSYTEYEFRNFRPVLTTCVNGYRPYLLVSHRLSNCSVTGNLTVDAMFTFTDGTAVDTQYYIPLVVTGFKPHYLQYMLPINLSEKLLFPDSLFCHKNAPLIKRLDLRFQQHSIQHYPAEISSVIVEYRCCSSSR